MKRTFSTRDLTLLSAFLDGQLTVREQAQLKARLNADPALLSELNSLQRTRQMLRKLPVCCAPRSFALKPDMIPARSTRQLFPAFRLASALSGFLLLLMLAANLLVGRLSSPMLSSSPENFVAQEKSVQDEQPPLIIIWGTPTPEMLASEQGGIGGGGGMGGAMPEAAKEMAQPTPAPTQLAEAPAAQSEEFVGETAIPPQDLAESRDAGSGPILGVQPVPANDLEQTAGQPESQPWRFSLQMVIALVSGGLGVTLVLTALAAFYFYRKEHL